MFQSSFLIDIGPVNIPITIVGMAVSVFVWYFLIKRQESKVESLVNDKDGLSDSLISLIIAGVILYKVWPVLENPSLIWTRGWSVIYFNGGSYFPFGLAFFIAGWFVWYVRRRHSMSLHQSGQMLIRGWIPALVIWSVMIREYGTDTNLSMGFAYQGQLYHPINFYFAAFLIVLLVIMVLMQKHTYPIEPWLLLLLSCFYIVLEPIRVIQDVFIIFDGLGWAWVTVALSVFWIIYSHQKIDQEGASQ